MAYFLRNLLTSRINNSRILRIRNAKYAGYCFYVNRNIYGDFQICICASLNLRAHAPIWLIFQAPDLSAHLSNKLGIQRIFSGFKNYSNVL